MQKVSSEYRESIDSLFRNASYIQAKFGIYDETIQDTATFHTATELADFSNTESIFSNSVTEYEYATLENNFTRVDGSQYLMPNDSTYIDTGVTALPLITDKSSTDSFCIALSEPTTLLGLTLTFGENYPVDFDVYTYMRKDVIEVRDNTKKNWATYECFEDCQYIYIQVRKMKSDNSRFRLHYVFLGAGFVYDNNSVIDCSINWYNSLITEELPQNDLTLTITNYDLFFNVDNPDSLIHFFKTGLPLSVKYGYQVSEDESDIEWIDGGKYYLSEWEADNSSCTLTCTDLLREFEDNYYDFTRQIYEYTENLMSAYDMCTDILTSVGLTENEDFIIDDSLKDIKMTIACTLQPIRDCLQQIANACCCIIRELRNGTIRIEPLENITNDQFNMSFLNMTSTPICTQTELIKDVSVTYYTYNVAEKELTVLVEEENLQVYAGNIIIYEFDTNYSSTFCEELIGRDMTFGYNCVQYTPSEDAVVSFEIEASNSISYSEHAKIIKILNNNGESIEWNNPLIDSKEKADKVLNWLCEYYQNSYTYEYDTRGNPELDVLDEITQENDFRNDMKVRITELSLNFNGAFSGHVVARREDN